MLLNNFVPLTIHREYKTVAELSLTDRTTCCDIMTLKVIVENGPGVIPIGESSCSQCG